MTVWLLMLFFVSFQQASVMADHAELLLKVGVDLRTQKNDVHTKVQPQHGKNDGGQASVHIA